MSVSDGQLETIYRDFQGMTSYINIFYDFINNNRDGSIKTSLKWLTVAMPLLENSKIQERDNTRERLEREKREPREIWSYSRWPIIV